MNQDISFYRANRSTKFIDEPTVRIYDGITYDSLNQLIRTFPDYIPETIAQKKYIKYKLKYLEKIKHKKIFL